MEPLPIRVVGMTPKAPGQQASRGRALEAGPLTPACAPGPRGSRRHELPLFPAPQLRTPPTPPRTSRAGGPAATGRKRCSTWASPSAPSCSAPPLCHWGSSWTASAPGPRGCWAGEAAGLWGSWKGLRGAGGWDGTTGGGRQLLPLPCSP